MLLTQSQLPSLGMRKNATIKVYTDLMYIADQLEYCAGAPSMSDEAPVCKKLRVSPINSGNRAM